MPVALEPKPIAVDLVPIGEILNPWRNHMSDPTSTLTLEEAANVIDRLRAQQRPAIEALYRDYNNDDPWTFEPMEALDADCAIDDAIMQLAGDDPDRQRQARRITELLEELDSYHQAAAFLTGRADGAARTARMLLGAAPIATEPDFDKDLNMIRYTVYGQHGPIADPALNSVMDAIEGRISADEAHGSLSTFLEAMGDQEEDLMRAAYRLGFDRGRGAWVQFDEQV